MTQAKETPKMLELLIVQTGRGKDGVMRHTVQDMVAEETEYFYNFEFSLGGNKVSSKSFGIPFIVHSDPVHPIVGTVGLKEDKEQLLKAVEDYFSNEMLPSLHKTVSSLQDLVGAIEGDIYDIVEIGGN